MNVLIAQLLQDVGSKIEKVPRGIRGEKSSKDMASSRNLVSTIGALGLANKPFNYSSWVALVYQTERPQLIRNHSLIERSVAFLCCFFALYEEEKEEICFSPITKAFTPTEYSKKQSDIAKTSLRLYNDCGST